MQVATYKPEVETRTERRIYVATVCKFKKEEIKLSLGNKRFVENLEDADIILLEDGFFKSPFLTDVFRAALKRQVTIKHFGGDETKRYLFSLVRDTVSRVKSFDDVASASRERENVIYRSAISVFLLKCGIHESEVAPFVGRKRPNMFHYVKLHPMEMKMTSLYEVIYTSLMQMI